MVVLEDTAAEVLELLARHTGFTLVGERRERARAAVLAAMRRAGITDGSAFVQLVQADSLVFEDLIAGIVVGETYFQREPGQWALVRDTILPEIVHRREPSHVIRCWSAGCASGEEAYSLAILLDDADLAQRSRVVGTDISRAALTRARQAVYTAWSLRTSSSAFVDRWFHRNGSRYVLDPGIRTRVAFDYLNLVADAFPAASSRIGEQDLILCRNVLLYFDRETIAHVAKKLFSSLAPGGWLVCGASDPSPAVYAPFQAVVRPEGIVYRRPLVVDLLEPAPHDAARGAVASTPEIWTESPEPVPGRDAGPLLERAPARGIRAAATIGGLARAERGAPAAAAGDPLDPEAHYVRAMLLVEQGRIEDALAAIRRVLYLDRTLAAAHFTLGVLLERVGDARRAGRSYRNAARAAAARPPDEPAPLSEGESHHTIALAARERVRRLTTRERDPR